MKRVSFVDQVADLFTARAGEWIDSEQLARVGGRCGWRTRVSNCRTDRGMRIENQLRRVEVEGRRFVVSEYKYVPPVTDWTLTP